MQVGQDLSQDLCQRFTFVSGPATAVNSAGEAAREGKDEPFGKSTSWTPSDRELCVTLKPRGGCESRRGDEEMAAFSYSEMR